MEILFQMSRIKIDREEFLFIVVLEINSSEH